MVNAVKQARQAGRAKLITSKFNKKAAKRDERVARNKLRTENKKNRVQAKKDYIRQNRQARKNLYRKEGRGLKTLGMARDINKDTLAGAPAVISAAYGNPDISTVTGLVQKKS
jgi:hypothetical protein